MLNENKNQFESEQSDLLKTILYWRFFKPWSYDMWDNYALSNDANLEIYITNVCNQNCTYCYLTRNPDLYPGERSPEHLLHNLKVLYDYILEQNYHIPKCEFFSGEIWQTQFGLDILELTYEYLKKGMRIDWFMIASNCSFVFESEHYFKVQHYIDTFNQIGHPLRFSISVDGGPIENMSRPRNDKHQKTEEDWEKLFLFAKHNGFGFHPMVSSVNVKYWIENYNWWVENLPKYGMNYDNIMMLEVRNADWTDESIADYQKFLNHLITYYLKHECNNDTEKFARALFHMRPHQGDPQCGGYIPWAFPEGDTFIGCTAATDLTIRLGDLAICPCHRTAYSKYLYGKFVVENDKIIDIEANNPQMAIKVLMSNFHTSMNKCDTCVYNLYCLKGCYGSQIESTGDPFIPSDNVCKFFDGKIGWLLQKYKELGVIDYLKTVTPLEADYEKIHKFLTMVKEWEQKNECMGKC